MTTLSKQHLIEELKTFEEAGLLRLQGKPNRSGLMALELLNKRLDEKDWLLKSDALFEPWLLTQVSKNDKAHPLLIYVANAQIGKHLSPHPLIDANYLKEQLRVGQLQEGYSLLYSYLQLSVDERRMISPSPWFDPAFYLKYNIDLTPEQRSNPFLHYTLTGATQCRPASSRFDPYKWKEKHPKQLHTAPIVDFLLRQYSDPNLQPTRPNLPGGITELDASGSLFGWAIDPDATKPPKVSVWWGQKWLGNGVPIHKNHYSQHQSANRQDFKIILPGFLADDLLAAAQKGELCLYLRTDNGEEIGHPKGWQADDSACERLGFWLKALNALRNSDETMRDDHIMEDTVQLGIENEMNQLAQRLRDHELHIRKRLLRGELTLTRKD